MVTLFFGRIFDYLDNALDDVAQHQLIPTPKPPSHVIPSLRDDFPLFVQVTMVYLVVYFAFKHYCSQFIQRDAKALNISPEKAKEAEGRLWEGCFLAFSWIFGVLSILNEPHLYDSTQMFIGYPYHPMSTMQRVYYALCFTYYFVGIFTLLSETRKKDFWQMMTHHFITVSLVLMSYHLRLHRFGILTLLLHDISDAFLHIGKYLNTMKPSARKDGTIDKLFACFIISWIVARYIVFPFRMLYTCSTYPFKYWNVDNNYANKYWHIQYTIVALMCCLQVLHIYWGYLIYKTLVKRLNKGQVDDARDEEQEDSTKEETKKHKPRRKDASA